MGENFLILLREFCVLFSRTADEGNCDLIDWRWGRRNSSLKGWKQPLKSWKKLLLVPPMFSDQLDRRWQTSLGDSGWSQVWKRLWCGWAPTRTWISIWRLLHRVYYSNSKGLVWGVSPGNCPLCGLLTEDLDYMYFSCRGMVKRWENVGKLLMGSSLALPRNGSLWLLVHFAVMKVRRSPTILMIIDEVLQTS